MNVRGFHPTDLDRIVLQPTQAATRPLLGEHWGPELATAGPAYTAEEDGRIIACAGFLEGDRGALLWSFLCERAPMRRLTKMARRLLEVHPYPKVVATTAVDFAPGCRWLSLLGFRAVEIIPEMGVDGRDHWLYERVP